MTQPNNFTPPPKPTKQPQPKPTKGFPEAHWPGKKTFQKTEINEIPKYSDSDLRQLIEYAIIILYSAAEDLISEHQPSGGQGEEDKRNYKSEISSRAASLRHNQKQGGLDA